MGISTHPVTQTGCGGAHTSGMFLISDRREREKEIIHRLRDQSIPLPLFTFNLVHERAQF